MTQKLSSIDLLGFHHQTALLESVGWDEEELNSLMNFVQEELARVLENKEISTKDADLILQSVSDRWGYESKEILKSIFRLETFYLNLNTQRSQDVN